MKHSCILAAFSIILIGCDSDTEDSQTQTQIAHQKKWYSAYVRSSEDAVKTVHADLQLSAGESRVVSIKSEESITVGCYLEKGFEVYKAKGSVWLGTHDKPRSTGGAPGVLMEFSPTNGVISVVVENDSPIASKVVIYSERRD